MRLERVHQFSRRAGEICGVVSGYAEILAERILTKLPSYETVVWERAGGPR